MKEVRFQDIINKNDTIGWLGTERVPKGMSGECLEAPVLLGNGLWN